MPFVDKDKGCARCLEEHECACQASRSFPDSTSLLKHLQDSKRHRFFKSPLKNYCYSCEVNFSSQNGFIQHLKYKAIHRHDLHQVACNGRYQVVQQFIHSQYANLTGSSHHAARSKHSRQIGFTPMHCAAFGGHEKALQVMLNWPDGDPNVRDPQDGRTPVHLAAWKGNATCLRLLLKHGGDFTIKDRNKQTAADLSTKACMIVILQHSFKTALKTNGAVNNSEENDIPEEGINAEEVLIKESVALPYEVLVRGPAAVAAFNEALKNGKARVSYIQLTIIGDVGAGKTSLVRTLKGEEFRSERMETHGIVTSMVEKTDLDSSWKAVDLNTSHVDEILAEKVADDLRGVESLGKTEEKTGPVLLEDLHHIVAERQPTEAEDSNIFSQPAPSTVEESEVYRETKTSLSEESPGKEQEEVLSPLQRDMPFDKISQSLSRSTSEEKTNYTKISIWDFAGHPLYQTMHHIFLNRRSFYVIVFSLLKFVQKSDEVLKSLRFWLNSVQVHTPKTTPIFLVGTHCKHPDVSKKDLEAASEALNEHLAEAFSTHLVRSNQDSFLFAIDNSLGSEDERATQLKRAIEKEASRMPLDELPIRWLHLEEAIMKQRQMSVGGSCCVTKNDVLEMVKKECGEVDSNEFENMLRFYHDSGVVVLPGELMHPSKQHPHLEDKAVLDPQYLVDVMTCLYDINPNMDTERLYKNDWLELEDKGMANKELLKYAWKKFEDPLEDLLILLEGVGMLCPLEVKCPEVFSIDDSTNESHVTKYVIPFHFKEKSLHRRWEKLCRQWKGVCAKDKILIFDFQAFLPPALFPFLLVKMIAESKQTAGMTPVYSRHMGIFSLANSFYFMIEEVQEFHQIRVLARHQHSKNLCELYEKLYNMVADICKEYFRFMKFKTGPPCPNPSCPGASIDGKVFESGSSSESSCEEEEEEEIGDREETRKDQNQKRLHVVQIYPQSPMTPLWCNHTSLEDFAEIREWCEPQQVPKMHFEKENKVDLKNISVEQCCMVIVSERLGNKWKKLGRLLHVSDTAIDNIEIENPHDQEERAYKMLKKWKQTATVGVVSANTLSEALKELCCPEIVNSLISHCCKHNQ